LDSLRASAGSTAIASPEPSAQKLTDVATSTDPFSTDQAHTYWMQANSLYDDSVYTPPPQHRIDSPNGTDAVMLQGFDWYEDSYWNHPPNGWWGVLAQDAPQIGAAGFNIIWFPPTSVGSYYPTEWYNFDSQWGTGDVLKQAVKAMHSAGVKVLADIILGHRSGSTNWVDFRNPDWPTTVIVNNDCVWSQPAYQNLPRSPNPSEGELDSGSRNLDNRNTTVQHDAVVFMRWLRNTTGFDGWRYDEVKSYSGTHTEYYNNETSPEFSIGEYYDGDRQLVTNWIDSTDSSSGKANASSAFDFPTKFNLISAVESDNYSGMMSNGAPSGLIGWWPAKSVTFVENHDTSPRDPTFIANATAEYKAERLLGYVYILTHPGVPCVFWPHFFQWGTDYQNTIINLIKIRKTAGITSTSAIHVDTATNNLYAAYITGTHQTLAVKLGTSWSWTPNGTGWTMVTSGDRYAIWAK
jgi:alpha-amylase